MKPWEPSSFTEVDLAAPAGQLGGLSPQDEERSRPEGGLWNELAAFSPELPPLQGALGFISLAPAVTICECSHAYLGVLAQGTLERAGF